MGGILSSLFGSKKDKPASKKKTEGISDQDQAILDLKRQRDRLKKYQKQLDGIIAREKEIARELLRQGKKDRAKLALRKKKYQENMLQKTDGQLMNLEELVNSIEYASVQSEIFKAMKQGNEALEKINEEMSIDEVEQLMEDTAEAIAYQEEISNILSQELTDDDDYDVLRELEAIEAEEIAELKLPDVPDKEMPKVEVQEEPAEDDVEHEVEDEVQDEVAVDKRQAVLA